MRTKRRLSATVSLLLSAFLVAACSGSASKSSSQPAAQQPAAPAPSGTPAAKPDPVAEIKAAVKGKKLVIGFSSDPTVLDTVGVKMVRILKEEFEVDVSTKSLSASTLAAAVTSGELNVGEVSLSRLAALKLAGGNPLVFATNDFGNDYVVVAKKEIATPADIKGKIWANSSAAGITVVIRNAFFSKIGLNYDKDVRNVLTGSSSATVQAFPAGRVDAGLLHPDQAASLMEANPDKFHVIYYTNEAVQVANDVWYADKAWVEKNPQMAQAISLATIKAARWAYDDGAAFQKLAKEYAPKFSDKVIAETYSMLSKVKMWSPNGGLSMEFCTQDVKNAVAAGALEKEVDCATFLSTAYQDKSLEILGKK